MTLPAYAMNQATFPELYERWLANTLFRPWAELTLQEVGKASDESLLDIACGTGIVARVAKEQLGGASDIVGVDISSDMLEIARSVAPDIDWRQGDAAALPLSEGEQFDIVVCQQGVQFFTDKPKAVAQMRQALKQGGTLAVTTWRSDEEIPFFLELRRIAERDIGPITDQRHSFGNATALRRLLSDGGLVDVRVKTVSHTIRFTNDAPLLPLNTMALVGMSAAGKAMSDQERRRIVEKIVSESTPVLQHYSDGSGLAFDLKTNLATATG